MDEVTGLHAFDNLDPVSALNVLPEAPDETPRPAPRMPPAAPAFRSRSLPPPPPPRGGAGGVSVPPPPQRRAAPVAAAPASARPPAPPRLSPSGRASAPPSSPSWANARAALQSSSRGPRPIADDDLTQRVEVPTRGGEEETRVVDDDMAATGLIQVGDQALQPLDGNGTSPHALMDLSATTVAASIDMDWDEDEEPQTNMRDELSSGAPPRASSMDFDPAVHVQPHAPASFSPPAISASRHSLMPQRGEPSPFVLASSITQVAPSWEDDAQTRAYMPEPITTEPGWARTTSTTQDVMLEEASAMRRGNLPWFALAAVVAVGLALGVRAMMAPPALATVTLVTQPADADVSVDGRPLVGQASPFTIQGLAPDAEHTLVVKADGHGEHSSSFRVEAGETKALPNVELAATRVDTGFALASRPEGAKLFIDGEPRDSVTPARIADLAPGLHTVRLEHPGFQPWETQVAVAAGQVLDLSPAQLAPAMLLGAAAPQGILRSARGGDGGSSARSEGGAKISRAEEARLERKARRAERRAEKAERAAAAKAAKAEARAQKAASKRGTAVAAAPTVAPTKAAPGGGVLRVNSRPWAQVFVDGRLVGNTPQLGIQLNPGNHKVKLVNPELRLTKQLSVSIAKGQTTTKVVNMIE
jgi:hypothetical protein